MPSKRHLPPGLARRKNRLLKRALGVGVVLWTSMVSMYALTYVNVVENQKFMDCVRSFQTFDRSLRRDRDLHFKNRAQLTVDELTNAAGHDRVDMWRRLDPNFERATVSAGKFADDIHQLRRWLKTFEHRKQTRRTIMKSYGVFDREWRRFSMNVHALITESFISTTFRSPTQEEVKVSSAAYRAAADAVFDDLDFAVRRTKQRTKTMVLIGCVLTFFFFLAFVGVLLKAIVDISAEIKLKIRLHFLFSDRLCRRSKLIIRRRDEIFFLIFF